MATALAARCAAPTAADANAEPLWRSSRHAPGCCAAAVRADDPLARPTPQEQQVVRLAATGASNKLIGAQLFLSPRTAGYHLYKPFFKLGVATREELAGYSSRPSRPPGPPANPVIVTDAARRCRLLASEVYQASAAEEGRWKSLCTRLSGTGAGLRSGSAEGELPRTDIRPGHHR